MMNISIVKPAPYFLPKGDLADDFDHSKIPQILAEAEVIKIKPCITVEPGKLPDIIDAAVAALLVADIGIYRFGTELVRFDTRNEEKESSSEVAHQDGSKILVPVNKYWLREQMAKVARWRRPAGENEYRGCDPDPIHAQHILERGGDLPFPALKGIISAPTMRLDGSILDCEGYDPQTRLILDKNGVEFPLTPENPTREDALQALEYLNDPFKEFPFICEASKSIPPAAILTGITRKTFDTSPMFCLDAPVAGSGKSTLAEAVSIIVLGHKVPAMNQGATKEEDEKRIASSLLAGDSIILLDNCTRPVEGDLLCSMITQEYVQIRVLGQSKRVRLPTSTLILATGNNMVIAGDMTRRVMLCQIDPKDEHPEERQFDFDPRIIAMEQRPRLVAAALTILKAYHAAGRPNPMPKIGSFEQWNIVREAIVWLGWADPAATRHILYENDPAKGELLECLTLLHRVFGEGERSLNQVRQHCESARVGTNEYNLYQFLLNISRAKTLNNRSVGRFLTSHKDRMVSGAILRKSLRSDAVYWRVEVYDQNAWAGSQKHSPPPPEDAF